jgi:hypothetical protein
MTARKTTTRKRPAAQPAKKLSAIDKFSGLQGLWKSVAQFGLNGVVAATMMYAVLVMVPEMQKAHLASIEKERELSRKDGMSRLSHAETAVEKIASSIDGLRDTFGQNQMAVRGNQSTSIELNRKMVELLEKHLPNKNEPLPSSTPSLP